MKSSVEALISQATSACSSGRLFVVVLAVALAVDLVTKHLADSRLLLGESRELLPFLSLAAALHNDGVAFGMLGGSTALIVVANVIALLVVAALRAAWSGVPCWAASPEA